MIAYDVMAVYAGLSVPTTTDTPTGYDTAAHAAVVTATGVAATKYFNAYVSSQAYADFRTAVRATSTLTSTAAKATAAGL